MRKLQLALLLVGVATTNADPGVRIPLRATYDHSAESSWAAKKVHTSRALDTAKKELWRLEGKGEMTFDSSRGGESTVRVNVTLAGQPGMPNATARRLIPNEDWREYNRLAFWIRTDVSGFPTLTLMITIRNASMDSVTEVHRRESTHNVTVPTGKWTLVHWEIPHVKRDRVVSVDFRPWVNKILGDPWDRAAYEIRSMALERVDADHYEGWNVAPGKIAFSHTGYLPSAKKVAVASGRGGTFEVARANGGEVVLKKNAERLETRLGEFHQLEFTQLQTPGLYVLRFGGVQTRPFRIGPDTWDTTIEKVMNFFYGERCGVEIPGVHLACHRDWQAVLGDKKIVMNGGWHDAGDLSQGLINTGESTHAMFSLADELRAGKRNPELLRLVLDEAKWGLDWIHKVRFDGGFRIGFASMNIWTNGIIGDADDRQRVALNNPNVNYIAASAGAAAYNHLKDSEPELARRSLAIAEEDWRYAISGVESPETQSTPAFAASEMELASQGIIASVELYRATKKIEYAKKAQELSAVVTGSQQRQYVGREFPLAGFFYTGPDRKTIFHQFHRASDQAPVVALTLLCTEFPDHPEWMTWYSAVALHAKYQKRTASTTEPYRVLPAYLYRDDEWQNIAEADRYGSSRESYRRQVLEGMPIGGGYYLRAFPVWFTRRGNYGILLSQAKALAAASRLRHDAEGMQLAERQLQWVVGLNPFAQSTMWGEGYDFAPQYSVSVGDLTGELPVGMMTHDDRDVPYWPATNSFVFKEVWVHPAARWLSVVQDVTSTERKSALNFSVKTEVGTDGSTVISVVARGSGTHSFTVRTTNLSVEGGETKVTLKAGVPGRAAWKARPGAPDAPWVAVVIADRNLQNTRDIVGFASFSRR